jgi:hypothetical protein
MTEAFTAVDEHGSVTHVELGCNCHHLAADAVCVTCRDLGVLTDGPIRDRGARNGWFKCGDCGASYRNADAADQCCSDSSTPAIIPDGGTKLGDYGAAGQTTLEDTADVDEDETCPSGSEWCDGPAMLEDGELCCAGCWIHHATDRQIAAWETHPDSAGGARKVVGDE